MEQEKEVSKVEKLLEQSEMEKKELENALDEARKLIEDTQNDLVEQKERADQLKTTIAHVASMHERQQALPNDLQVIVIIFSNEGSRIILAISRIDSV